MADRPETPADPSPFPAPAGGVRVFLTTAPPDLAEEIATRLVEERLAACVSCVPGVRSVYRWQGALQNDPETLLVVKTTGAALPALSRRLRELHPYELPEELVLEPEGGGAAWLAWVAAAGA